MRITGKSAADRVDAIAKAIKEDVYGVVGAGVEAAKTHAAAAQAQAAWRADDERKQAAIRLEAQYRAKGGPDWLKARTAVNDLSVAEVVTREAYAAAERAHFDAATREQAARVAMTAALGPQVRSAVLATCREAVPKVEAAIEANARIFATMALGNDALGGVTERRRVIGDVGIQGLNASMLEAWLAFVKQEAGESL